MKLVQVTYDSLFDPRDPTLGGRLARAAETIAGLTGLIWTIWLYDDARKAGSGLYLFDLDSHAHAWGDIALPLMLETLPGISNIRIRYFDVDERLTALTQRQPPWSDRQTPGSPRHKN
jgi:hypothetical protein